MELFVREDCVKILTSKYLSIIKHKKLHEGCITSFEMLLASNMSMNVLSDNEKIQFMAMALERAKIKIESSWNNTVFHIMAVILKSFNYTPFLIEVGEEWIDSIWGYVICSENEHIILKYSEQFINNKKNEII